MADRSQIVADLEAEGAALDDMVADLPAQLWAAATPAQGWTIAHAVAHLAWTDEVALLAATDPLAFAEVVAAAVADPLRHVDDAAERGAAQPTGRLLDRWRAGRAALAAALREVPDGTKLPWFGPPMSAASMATARIMETWAHGQDVADALGRRRTAGPALRHVAHLGVRTRDFAYVVNGLPVPGAPVRVELAAPDGSTWAWGPEDAGDRVTGAALDFCLLVTQRRHRDDLDLTATEGMADEWLAIAQAFAGPPGFGRAPAATS